MLLVLLLVGCAALVLWLTRAGPEDPIDDAEPQARRPAPPARARPVAPPAATDQPGPAGPARATGSTVLRASWGSGPSQVGRRVANESNPEAPMGLALDSQGRLLLLDQVNRRVLRYDTHGRALSPLTIGSDTAQDLALGPNGELAVLDRIGPEPGVQRLDSSGRTLGQLSVVGGRVTEGGSITGLFHGPGGLYVETDNDDLVLVADKQGRQSNLERTLPGRPTRDGRLFIKAGIASKAAGRAYVQAHLRDGKLAWETPVNLARPLLQILMLDSDTAGNVYLGAEVGRQDPATQQMTDLATVVLRLDRNGQPSGWLLLPPTTTDPAETYRPLAVSPDGRIYQLVAGPAGLTVTVFRF